MKITDVEAIPLSIPMKAMEPPSPWQGGTFESQVIVVVTTDEGIVGYGEAFGLGIAAAACETVIRSLKPLLIGRDPLQIAALTEELFRRLHVFGRYGITVFAISGVEIALWDIAGKAAGVPLYRLLGGAPTQEVEADASPTTPDFSGRGPRGAPAQGVKAYASFLRYDQPEHVAQVVGDALEEGYDTLKLHQIDVESVQAARRVAGDDVRLCLDTNCVWTPHEAVEMARRLAPYNLYWLEEPVWPPEDYQGLARVQADGGTPIASGENLCTVFAFRDMVAQGAATFLQPSVTKVGGIAEWRKIATLAEAHGLRVAPHSPYCGPGFLATLHLVAATPQAEYVERLYVPLETTPFGQPLPVKNGYVEVPQGPGLGLDPDPDILRRYPLK